MIGYKLFRKRVDGTYGSLFIDCRKRLTIGNIYIAECHLRKGYAYRPGWHVCKKPYAPHLSSRGRVWCKVQFLHAETLSVPKSRGGTWYLGSTLKIIEECKLQGSRRTRNRTD